LAAVTQNNDAWKYIKDARTT